MIPIKVEQQWCYLEKTSPINTICIYTIEYSGNTNINAKAAADDTPPQLTRDYIQNIIAAKLSGAEVDSNGNPKINGASTAKIFNQNKSVLSSYGNKELAALYAGIGLNSNGEPLMAGASNDARLKYFQAMAALGKSSTSHQICMNLSQIVNSREGIEQEKKDFIISILPTILKYHDSSGIPLEIIFGQICIESNYGQNTIYDKYTGQNANNYFGFKGAGTAGSVLSDTYEYFNREKVVIEDQFRAYNNVEESLEDYIDLLIRSYSKYVTSGTPEDWANALNQGGYAAAPNYGETVLSVSRYWRIK